MGQGQDFSFLCLYPIDINRVGVHVVLFCIYCISLPSIGFFRRSGSCLMSWTVGNDSGGRSRISRPESAYQNQQFLNGTYTDTRRD